ncbi:hypothetical protein DFH09DRAFT_5587 [Mycena vulgaris]|nr:hypothetical protein DFH09DRAFT_5587 [Mycena vulgaris]
MGEEILEFGLPVAEDDLVVVSSTIVLEPNLESEAAINLRFYQMSTRSAPRAQQFVVPVPVAAVGRPDFTLDICGCKVSLVHAQNIALAQAPIVPPDRLLIYDWMQGCLIMDLTFVGKYSAVVFLSTDVLLLTCTKTGTLELWKIPENLQHPAAGPEVSLRLP